ncbi:hypothetical protein IFM89_001067 [Coptis chinensis]|uniref:Jacalin-type lectin domain-containing protein n=1 Tax=Coptis chinensis TaxID=261450 RepID=A0A835LD21_9MAGN|nr:hypothetical protein IFM89_001067 [Coptis chinensis]
MQIDIDLPEEYLTSISGHYGYFRPEGPLVIRSLRFVTNVTKYGPIGPADGTYFSLPMEGGKIIGFHGKAGQFLDSIGVYVKPVVYPSIHSIEEASAKECKAVCFDIGLGAYASDRKINNFGCFPHCDEVLPTWVGGDNNQVDPMKVENLERRCLPVKQHRLDVLDAVL